MEIVFDPAKNRDNLRDHQIDLADVDGVFFDPFALTREDRRCVSSRWARMASVACWWWRTRTGTRISG
jgi:uncharacterized DUF497 family protein